LVILLQLQLVFEADGDGYLLVVVLDTFANVFSVRHVYWETAGLCAWYLLICDLRLTLMTI
jgi:hypothetical protein